MKFLELFKSEIHPFSGTWIGINIVATVMFALYSHMVNLIYVQYYWAVFYIDLHYEPCRANLIT